MKTILIVLSSSLIGKDIAGYIKKKGFNTILKKDIDNLEAYLEEFKPVLLITHYTSRLKNLLLQKLKNHNQPVLFFVSSLEQELSLELPSEYNFLHLPIDYKELEEKITKLLIL